MMSWIRNRQPPIRALSTSGSVVIADVATLSLVHKAQSTNRLPGSMTITDDGDGAVVFRFSDPLSQNSSSEEKLKEVCHSLKCNMASSHQNLQALLEDSLKRTSSFTRTIMPRTMTAEEVIGFVNEKKNAAIIATVRKDGSPHTAWNPIAYVDGKLYTYADPHSTCYKNLKREGRVSVAVTGGSKAVFIQGEAEEAGQVSKMIDTLLARILSVVKGWIPASSYNYASLADCQASIFEIKMAKIITYKTKNA